MIKHHAFLLDRAETIDAAASANSIATLKSGKPSALIGEISIPANIGINIIDSKNENHPLVKGIKHVYCLIRNYESHVNCLAL